ncbi:MAG: hypothetical protein K2K24_00795, partial [Clostridia bacterium]|nr:hypothetical protein [Clostridia bacterium]
MIIMCLIMASAMTFFMPNKNAEAFQGTTNIASQSTNLGEMLLSGYENRTDGKTFDGNVFWKLVSQITGVSNPNVSTLAGLGNTDRTSANFRSNNGNKDVVVTINGIPWTATYLSQNNNGEQILALWQADAISFNYYDANTQTMVNNAVNATWTTSDNSTNEIAKYPPNSYGTSFMATSVMNNGGAWAKTGSGTPETVNQNTGSTYAIFTMDSKSVAGSLTNYIEIPDNMPYQHDNKKESAKTQSYHSTYSYDTNNEVLGAPITANMSTDSHSHAYYSNGTIDRTGYLSWGNDKIWLPSFAEVGYSDTAKHPTSGKIANGLWQTSANQRSTSTSVSGNSVTNYWLRSSCYTYYMSSYTISAAGTSMSTQNLVTTGCAVRPAFHLNLSKVANAATTTTPTYKKTADNT